MAIIQSILVGKGKGKIGNVVLSGLKGQTVAKQLNSSPSNPRTVAQTDNRIKMANAVLAWQFLALFFASAKGLRKPLESTYNAFIRTVKNGMSGVLWESRRLAAVEALELNLFGGNWFTVAIDVFASDGVKMSFTASGIPWASTYKARVIVIDSVDEKQTVVDVAIPELSYNSGVLEVPVTGLVSASVAAAYIYDSASSKITNVAVKTV